MWTFTHLTFTNEKNDKQSNLLFDGEDNAYPSERLEFCVACFLVVFFGTVVIR
jgi:hypothetical protein